MLECVAGELENELRNAMQSREEKILGHMGKIRALLEAGNHPGICEEIAQISRHTELLTKDLRELMIDFYGDLQTSGIQPARQPYPALPDVKIRAKNGCVIITTDAMLPFPIKGSVYYLHEKLDMALVRFMEERKAPRPYFRCRCAVVFIHHYGSDWEDLRHLRDYDNVEHRCITNVLAAHLLWGDSPKCMIAMDVLAPGKKNYTEIRVMPLPQFRDFVMSEKIEYVP